MSLSYNGYAVLLARRLFTIIHPATFQKWHAIAISGEVVVQNGDGFSSGPDLDTRIQLLPRVDKTNSQIANCIESDEIIFNRISLEDLRKCSIAIERAGVAGVPSALSEFLELRAALRATVLPTLALSSGAIREKYDLTAKQIRDWA